MAAAVALTQATRPIHLVTDSTYVRDGIFALLRNVSGLGAARADYRVAIVVATLALAFFATVPRAARLALAWRLDVVVKGFGAHGAGRQEHGTQRNFHSISRTQLRHARRS